MPPKHRLDKGAEKKRERIDTWPLLKSIFNEEGVKFEFELERRYTPARLLTGKELSRYRSADIEQCYVRAEDSAAVAHTFRLRRTQYKNKKEPFFQVADKKRIAESEGRREVYSKFSPRDPRADEFERLWKRHDWRAIHKTRYYIPHKLPSGSRCEIHYDVHHGGRFGGFVKIEVEFKNDADALYVQGGHGYQPVLPDWIGQDVTADPRYSSKTIAKEGLPEELIVPAKEGEK